MKKIRILIATGWGGDVFKTEDIEVEDSFVANPKNICKVLEEETAYQYSGHQILTWSVFGKEDDNKVLD